MSNRDDLRRDFPPKDYDDPPTGGEPDYRSRPKKGLTTVAMVAIAIVACAVIYAVVSA